MYVIIKAWLKREEEGDVNNILRRSKRNENPAINDDQALAWNILRPVGRLSCMKFLEEINYL